MSLVLTARVDVRDVDVAFDVDPGETVAVLGPNGSGKSTAMAVIAGLLRPDAGRVVLDGRVLTDVGGSSPVAIATHARRTALLGQQPLLFPHLTALDNVAFGPRSAGAGRAASRRTAAQWLDEMGVGHLSGRKPSQLSGGQAQRVAIARALAATPGLLLLDEPMAALDVEVLPALRQTLRRVLADRTTVIVTHDPLDALLLADRAVVLNEGRVVETGAVRDVLTQPRSPFTARLAGLNLLSGTWTGNHLDLGDGRSAHGLVAGSTPNAGARGLAVFRPHSVSVLRTTVEGSPRNAFAATVTGVEPHADVMRVRAGELAADITVLAAAELGLVPGDRVIFSVKATEVTVYAL